MPEFRIEGDALRRESKIRWWSWGTVLVLTAVMVCLVVLRCFGLKFGPGLSWSLCFCFFVAFFGSCVLAFREALSAAERQMVFTLDDKGITRNRRGFPPLHIAFSDIDYLGEEMKWLIVRSAVPTRKIGISKSVKGYELIRAELSKHYPLSSPERKFQLGSTAPVGLTILAWAAMFWFRDPRVVIPCGVVAITLLAVASYRLWTLLQLGQKKSLSWIGIGAVWIAAILLICLRLTLSGLVVSLR